MSYVTVLYLEGRLFATEDCLEELANVLTAIPHLGYLDVKEVSEAPSLPYINSADLPSLHTLYLSFRGIQCAFSIPNF